MKHVIRMIIITCGILIAGCNTDPTTFEGVSSLRLESNWVISELDWSPDGRYLAFTVDTGKHHAIYILDLQMESYYSIKEYNDRTLYEAQGPSWSPDSHLVILYYPSAFVTAGPGSPFVRLAPFDIVTIDAQTGELSQGVWEGSYATWGVKQNEVIVVDSDIGQLDGEVPIYLVNLLTGEARQLAKTVAGIVLTSEALDASSTGLLAFRNKDKLEIIDLNSGEAVGRVNIESRLYSPAWSPDGEILAYVQDMASANENKWRGIIYFSTANGSCRSEPLDIGSIVKSIDWSPDGKQLAFTTNDFGKIYFLDLTVGVGKALLDSYQARCLPYNK